MKIETIWYKKYQLIKSLGKGGTSQVFLVRHLRLDSLRAVKRIPKEKNNHLHLLKEAYILKNLKHSSIPIIYDIEEDDSYSYIIQEYINGKNLKEYKKANKKIKEKKIIDITIQLCDLIEYLHNSNPAILHLDIKPENIIIDKGLIKLIDFGNSIFYDSSSKELPLYASKGYSAPEIYQRNKVDKRTDLYSIGALIYYMMTGLEEYNLNKGHGRKKDYSINLKRIVKACLRDETNNRYRDVAKLKEDLLAISSLDLMKSYPPKTFSIASSKKGIGTSHLSLMLSTYFKNHNIKSIYINQENNKLVLSIKNLYKNTLSKDNIYFLRGIYMAANHNIDKDVIKDFPIQIKDYGVLNKNNIDDFMKGETRLVILGGKEWEIEESEKLLEYIKEYKIMRKEKAMDKAGKKEEENIYLFNFLEDKKYKEIIRNMGDLKTLRIPYNPNPFKIGKNSQSEEFLCEITEFKYRKKGLVKKFFQEKLPLVLSNKFKDLI